MQFVAVTPKASSSLSGDLELTKLKGFVVGRFEVYFLNERLSVFDRRGRQESVANVLPNTDSGLVDDYRD